MPAGGDPRQLRGGSCIISAEGHQSRTNTERVKPAEDSAPKSNQMAFNDQPGDGAGMISLGMGLE